MQRKALGRRLQLELRHRAERQEGGVSPHDSAVYVVLDLVDHVGNALLRRRLTTRTDGVHSGWRLDAERVLDVHAHIHADR